MLQNENLESVLENLKSSSSNEDLLLALSLLPKVLNPDNEFEVEQAFETIPWKFVHQMMVTKGMEPVGVYIWQAFCVPKYVKHKNIMKRLEPATKLLCRQDVEFQVKLVIMQTIGNIIGDSFVELIGETIIENILMGVGIDDEKVQFIDCYLSNSTNIDKRALDLLFDYCIEMLGKNSKHSLRLTSVLVFKMQLNRIQVEKIKNEFKRLLKSKLEPESIDSILCMCGKLSSLSEFYNESIGNSNNSLSEEQFWVILTHICGAEIRISLDKTTTNVNEMKISIPMYYMLLENIITNMVDENIVVGLEQLESIRKSMGETFFTVASFLSERWVIIN